jgi:hypothetical protein
VIDGVSVKLGKHFEVLYQAGYTDEGMLPEAAIIIRKYDQSGPVYGIAQGDQEIVVGGEKSLAQLAKALQRWSKEAA